MAQIMQSAKAMIELAHLKVAVIAEDSVEESQLCQPVEALRQAQAQVEILGLHRGKIQVTPSANSTITSVDVDRLLDNASAADYDALLIPGGSGSIQRLERDPKVKNFIHEFESSGKPIAFLEEASSLLMQCGCVRGRSLTASNSLQPALQNSGACFIDQPVVVDKNWVSGKSVKDLSPFINEMIQVFSRATPAVIQISESA